MKAKTKLKLKLYLRVLPVYVAHILSMAVCSAIHGKYAEAVIFLVSELSLRYKFEKTYHCKTAGLCFYFTTAVIWLCIPRVMPINISYLSGVLVGLCVAFVSYHIQCHIDNVNLLKEKDKQLDALIWRIKKYSSIDIYKMSEDELRTYATSKGLPEIMIDTLILKVLHNYRWVDIMTERNYSKTAIRYHKAQIIEKLDIKL